MCDEFPFDVNVKECGDYYTKRKVLSIISAIFDPLGLLGPVIITTKIFMQQLWKKKFDWDDPLPHLLVSIRQGVPETIIVPDSYSLTLSGLGQ